MNLEDLIGKKEKVKIVGLNEDKKYYITRALNDEYTIYIENDGDYEKEELIGSIEDCLVTKVVNDKLLGFLMTNRKFENDLRKISDKIENTNREEFDEIEDIYLMERLKIKGKVVGLYMVDEGEVGKYYLDTIEIGTFIKKMRQNNIIFKDRKVEDEIGKQIKDVVQGIDLYKKEISLRQEEEKQMKLLEKLLDIPELEIRRFATVDLNQIIEDKQQIKDNSLENQKKKEVIQLQQNIIKNKEDKPITTKDINVKQETKLSGKITNMKTLGQLLEKNNKMPKMEGKKFVKMGVIESDHKNKLKDANGKQLNKDTTRYSLVAIASDGTVVPLDLKQDAQDGRNPTKQNYQINHDGQVIQDDVLSRFRIGDGSFAIKNGQMGEIKLYHSQGKSIGGNGIKANMSLDRELETKNVWRMNKDQRDLAAEYSSNYRSVDKSYREAKQHEDETGEILENDKLKVKDVDGDKNTKTHEHFDIDYNELATGWGYYVDGKPNAEKAKEIFEEKVKENPDKNKEEIVEMVKDEIDEELHRGARTR